MTKPLSSQIFTAGTKFIVTDATKDTTFGPGTTGFVSYVRGRDQHFSNVFYYRIVTTRRGKAGKSRIELNDISTPVFELEGENFIRMMPDEKRRYYVHIKPMSVENNVMEFSHLDFLAYGFAYARWVRKLNTRAKHMNAWPDNPNDLLNTFVHMNNYFSEDLDMAKTRYAREHNVREALINKIRIMESSLVKCSLSYMHKVANIETRAMAALASMDPAVMDKKVSKVSLDYYSNKAKSLPSLEAAHTPKGKQSKSFMASLAAGISWS